MISAVPDAEALAKRAEKDIPGAEGSVADMSVKRALFGQFAVVWNDAEESADKSDALKILQELRPRLKLRMPNQSFLEQASMYSRMALMLFVFLWGGTCVLTLTPLRWLHPFLRRCGVPLGWLPVNAAFWLWCQTMCSAAGVRVRIQGKPLSEQWGKDANGIIVYNHMSSLDPFLVYVACSQLAPKFVGKASLFKLPVFGWLSFAMGHIPIVRSNREKAVHAMNVVGGGIIRSGRSVAVAPEGARSKDGHLSLPFKKGTFYFQQQTKAPLLPIVLHGAYDLWPRERVFTRCGEVHVRFLEPQKYVDAEDTHEAIEAARVKLQRSISENTLHFPEPFGRHSLTWRGVFECSFFLVLSFGMYWQFYRFYSSIGRAVGLSTSSALTLFAVISFAEAVVVDRVL
eukprot:TRINITY_DN62831_c0_g1_i1.p1 TRINITY_DN62831_c0_g1~~TRINITY_DN62831_c0_g1_i1.p1  ORF type:complete len:400 (+),score=45.00 TRINITY_DN62831_c0_g1_i1:112-1311(+)